MDVQPRVPERRKARVGLAADCRRTARLGMHETIANQFSLSVSRKGTRLLTDPKATVDREGPSHAC